MADAVAGIILAAGLSKRFGGCKQLVPFRGKALIKWSVEAALNSDLDFVCIVVGFEASRVRAALEAYNDDRRLQIIENRAFQDGQASSVVTGLQAVQRRCTAAMFLMADQPLLGAAEIDALLKHRRRHPDGIVCPVAAARRRAPVTFAKRFYNEIAALSGDAGARSVIEANPTAVWTLEFEREEAFLDIDRQSDLKRLEALETAA